MLRKPSAQTIEACKEFLNKAIEDGKIGGTYDGYVVNVSCCAYGKKKEGKPGYSFSLMGAFQGCHAEVPSRARGHDIFLDHIQDSQRKDNPSPQERIAFLQYLMDHPIFKDSFWEHDAKKAVEEKIMVRRVDVLPSNVMMFCVILTRAMWESYQNKIPSRFVKFVELGLEPDRAFIASHLFRPTPNGVSFNPLPSSGHNAIQANKITNEYVRNYLNHKVIMATTRTIYDGGEIDGVAKSGGQACVDTVFAKNGGGYGFDVSPEIPRHATTIAQLQEWFDVLMEEKN